MHNRIIYKWLRRSLVACVIWTTIIGCKSGIYSTRHNLDFEYRSKWEAPTRWDTPDRLFTGYDSALDFDQKQHGAASLRLTQTDPGGFGWASFGQTLPVSSVAGHEVELRGWVRTEGVTDGFADFYIGDGEVDYHTLLLDTAGRGVRNTTEWTRVTLKKHIGEKSSAVAIGGILKGPGTAWFDNLELLIDGKPLCDTLIPAPKSHLTRADKRELSRFIYPLRTFKPDESKAGEDKAEGGKTEESIAGADKAGECKAGECKAGERNTGECNAGEPNTDECNTGARDTAERNTEERDTAERNTAERNTDERNTDECNTGERNTDECNTEERNTDDLRVLETLIGASSVVALGENSHGSSEIYGMKHRMIRYLAGKMGFDIFSIEANMPESYRVNEYTVEGKGNAKKLIAGMYFWIWMTQEMLDLVEWMRDFNRSGRRIAYTGFDMQAYEESVSILDAAFRHDAQAGELLWEIYASLKKALAYLPDNTPRIDPEIAATVARDLTQLEERIGELPLAEEEKAWLRQNTALLRQYLGQGPLLRWRDRCMAENLLWIKRQNSSSRIVAWAHNGHIEKEAGAMGGVLCDSLGTDYVNFGFTFYDGEYTGICPGSNEWVQTAQRAFPGTLEYLLHKLGVPVFILDLKRMRAENSPVLKWIDDLRFRHVGAVKLDNEFRDRNVTKKFDYLVFIRQTTPSHLLVDM